MLDAEQRHNFETGFVLVLMRFGADELGLREAVTRAVDESIAAWSATADDGGSLSALDVLRIRAGKFAATRLPAALYRDAAQLAALRREILRLSEALLGPDGQRGRRF
jgi:hypothetical protein